MREHQTEFDGLSVKIAVVTFETGFLAREYVVEEAIPWPLLVDEKREMYQGYGMLAASFWDIWGPKSWWVYFREIAKGKKPKKSEGDISQRGGDVLIDPAGVVRLHQIGEGPADRPPLSSILQAIKQE